MNTKNSDLYHDFEEHKVVLKNKRYYILGQITYIFAFIVHFWWCFSMHFFGAPKLAYFNIFSASCFVVCLYLNKKGHYLTALVIATIEVLLHQILAVQLVGWGAGFQYYLFSLIFLPFLTDKKAIPLKLFLSLAILISFMVLEHYYQFATPYYQLNEAVMFWYNKANIFCALGLICVWAYYFNASVNAAEDAFEREQEIAENLLRNILPDSIAGRLKQGASTIADGYQEVTVLFLDIVGFTPLSTTKTPQELVEILNYIFSAFDDLAEKYGLEKIKTIGDSYMVACGVPDGKSDHAHRVADFALELEGILQEANQKLGTELKIRVGINTGPVVAGVIGKKKFIYDLWGDAVNVASRMESHGVVSKVQVSESTYELLKYDFVLSDNGEKEIKGRGPMRTYIVESRQ